MKIPFLFFAAGAGAAVLVTWFLKSPPESESRAKKDTEALSAAMSTKLEDALAQQTAHAQALEKELKDLKRSSEVKAAAMVPGLPEPARTPFEQRKMEALEKRQDKNDVSREVDRLTLRLKLTEDQKADLRSFLTESKEKQRAAFRAMHNGTPMEIPSPTKGMDGFFKGLLTADQQAEYARAREDQRQTRAEEYAQRKLRKLNNDLNLSGEQKDKLFQAFAQQMPEATDPVKNAGDSDMDRKAVLSILTPEQMAVYDQRRNEEREQMIGMTREENGVMIEEFPVSLPTGDEPEDDEDDAAE